jgi:hypothetical protein
LSQRGTVIGPAVSIGAKGSSARVSRKWGDFAPREPDETGATYNGFVRRAGSLTACRPEGPLAPHTSNEVKDGQA